MTQQSTREGLRGRQRGAPRWGEGGNYSTPAPQRCTLLFYSEKQDNPLGTQPALSQSPS
jgi:hypothetical protein